jgi:hypothetical protein
MQKCALGIALVLGEICGSAQAQSLEPGSSLVGYQCYHIDARALKLTPDEAWSGKRFPPVFKEPSETSDRLGVASGIVYVAWPLQRQNGFVKIARIGGKLGWISADLVRPLYREPGSSGGCTLSWRGNQIQFHLDPGANGWLFPNRHDIPADKIR